MKQYVFRPDGCGPMTYSVMADTEASALDAIRSHRESEAGFVSHDEWAGIDSTDEGEKVYSVEVYDQGVVAENSNA
jgi:hypothetical protein